MGLAALAMAVSVGLGCRDEDAFNPEPQVPPPPSADLTGLAPVPGRHLDRAKADNAGLYTVLGADGLPHRQGDNVDPMVVESRRFYDTVGSPGLESQSVDYPDPFTSEAPAPKKTAPLTFAAWKTAFGFPARESTESLAEYRKRTGIVVYYNRNELGLGRELGCSEFTDGQDAQGMPLIGLACFVTNFGPSFQEEAKSLAMAIEGAAPRNTVCITYRPSMEAGYQVQFYTYNGDGKRQEWAQLDNMGPRPHPQVCINCHGGSYDDVKHLARDARFLPLDPNMVVFTGDTSGGLDRVAQEESIRKINAVSLRTPLASAQREQIALLYPHGVDQPHLASMNEWVPPGWNGNIDDRDLFNKVVKPYCATCHLAIDKTRGGVAAPSYNYFGSAAAFRGFPMHAVVCGNFSMPNAQPTMTGLWDTSRGPITIGARAYPSGADALLAAFNMDRSQCSQLPAVGTCDRGPDPDSLCGNAQSGTACNRATGRCVPDFSFTRGAGPVRGYCRMDGTRGCPTPLACVPMATPIPGLERFDGTCGGLQ